MSIWLIIQVASVVILGVIVFKAPETTSEIAE
jgi:hypothetical protein